AGRRSTPPTVAPASDTSHEAARCEQPPGVELLLDGAHQLESADGTPRVHPIPYPVGRLEQHHRAPEAVRRAAQRLGEPHDRVGQVTHLAVRPWPPVSRATLGAADRTPWAHAHEAHP